MKIEDKIIVPKASVLMLTYNHEKYVAQAIDSVLQQITNFNFEIVIGEDFSTDATRTILLEYRDKYPDLINVLLPDVNQRMFRNYLATLEACSGQYIAILEGDDYWTDRNKLQKQVDFLDSHKDFAICFHKVKILKDGKLVDDYLTKVPGDISTIFDLAKGNFIHTPSVVYRSGLIQAYPEWMKECPVLDYVVNMLNAQHGKIKYLSDTMAVYRIHDEGVWGNTKYEEQLVKWIKMQDLLILHFDENISNIIKRNQAENILILYHLLKKNYNEKSIQEKFQSIKINPLIMVNYYENRISNLLLNKIKSLLRIFSRN